MIAAIYVSSAMFTMLKNFTWLLVTLRTSKNHRTVKIGGQQGFIQMKGEGHLDSPHKFENHDVIITSTATIRSTTKYSIIIAEPDNSCL